MEAESACKTVNPLNVSNKGKSRQSHIVCFAKNARALVVVASSHAAPEQAHDVPNITVTVAFPSMLCSCSFLGLTDGNQPAGTGMRLDPPCSATSSQRHT